MDGRLNHIGRSDPLSTNDLYAWTGHGSGSTASVANGLNQLTSVGGAGVAHDARGNLTSDPAGGKTYGYSSENLLTSVSGGVTLAYDAAMRLQQVAGAATTRFAYDGVDMIAEYDGADALLRRYVHGPGIDEPLVHYEGADTSTRRFLHADERGSVIAISDGSGAMVAINKYDEYGKPQATNQGRFQYTGQMWLPGLGLYHYKARMYAPHLGRFVQPDPLNYYDGPNLYAYVGNDPLNLTDPLGLDAFGEKTEPKDQSGELEQEIVVLGCTGVWFGEICVKDLRQHLGRILDVFAETYLKPPERRRRDETSQQCMARVTSPERLAPATGMVELGRGQKGLYPRGAPAGASGTSHISRSVRGVEKMFGGGGVGSRGNYPFGAKTAGGAIGRALSNLSVIAGAAVGGFEIGKIAGAHQVCR